MWKWTGRTNAEHSNDDQVHKYPLEPYDQVHKYPLEPYDLTLWKKASMQFQIALTIGTKHVLGREPFSAR